MPLSRWDLQTVLLVTLDTTVIKVHSAFHAIMVNLLQGPHRNAPFVRQDSILPIPILAIQIAPIVLLANMQITKDRASAKCARPGPTTKIMGRRSAWIVPQAASAPLRGRRTPPPALQTGCAREEQWHPPHALLCDIPRKTETPASPAPVFT